jgi:hypothetical protein
MKLRAEVIGGGRPRAWRRAHRAVGGAIVAVGLAAAIGCGGKPAPEPANPDDFVRGAQTHAVRQGKSGGSASQGEMGAKGEMGEMGEMAGLPPALKKFHDTLAPRWHADHGAARTADTCGAIAQFQTDAAAVAASPAPRAADPSAWSAGGKQLVGSVAGLETACKANDAAAFEPAFTQVHDGFHRLMETLETDADSDAATAPDDAK